MSFLAPGTRIADRYRIEQELASGGMGAVYRAHDEKLARPVAIKILLAELAADPTQIARFEREAFASARLTHPGIVQVHDFGKTDQGLAFLVMELISGRTLATVLDDGRISPARALDIAEQALAALGAAHEAGIIHRDLKPANLMLVPIAKDREHVKILDFGIAQLKTGEAYARLTATGDILGTPSYMAPEQARSEPADARTDVYSMGMVLWCCLTGQKPWGNAHLAAMVIAVQTEMPTRADLLSADVPKAVALVVEKAVSKRPEDRFTSAADFAQALSRAANAIPPDTRAPLPGTVLNPLGTPAPIPPAPVRAAPAKTTPMAAPIAAKISAPIAAPATKPARKPRWWLRILLAVLALTVIGVVGAIALVLILGLLGIEAFMSLPNAQHPAGGSITTGDDPTCAAAERCCSLAGGSDCASYTTYPLDPAGCRAAIGSFGDTITQSGGNAAPCSPSYIP